MDFPLIKIKLLALTAVCSDFVVMVVPFQKTKHTMLKLRTMNKNTM